MEFTKVLVLLGIIMRVGYMIYTPARLRGHDFGGYGENSHGHFRYIYLLYSTGHLPTTNAGQFYHPPFFHILAASCMRLVHFLTGINDPVKLIEAGKLGSLVAFLFHIIMEIGAIRIDRRCKKSIYRIESQYIRIGFPIVWFLILGSYVLVNLQLPYGCTMDFRYVVPIVVLQAISLGYMVQTIQERLKEGLGCKKFNLFIGKMFIGTISLTTMLFSVLSITMFTNIS